MSISAEDIETAARGLVPNSTFGENRTWSLAIDECSDHPDIRAVSRALLEARLITGATPVWNQRRQRKDGSICYAVGGAAPGPRFEIDWGKPEERTSWPDTAVAIWVVGMLSGGDIIFVSENIRRDSAGIRTILKDHVAPHIGEPFRLVGLFKKGKTSYSQYCQALVQMLAAADYQYGYREVLV